MAISQEHHSLWLFQEAAKRVGFRGTRWAFLGNQRLRGAPRKNPDRQAWQAWWGMELPDKPLPDDAKYKLHGIGNWLPFWGADECLLIDSNGKDSCHTHDLNVPMPERLYGRYNVVMNAGTSEHVWPNQKQVFRTCHDLCKPGGLIMHAIPCFGCDKHGHWLYPLAWMKELADRQFYQIEHLSRRDVPHAKYPGQHYYAVAIFKKLTDDIFNSMKWQNPAPNARSKVWKTSGGALSASP